MFPVSLKKIFTENIDQILIYGNSKNWKRSVVSGDKEARSSISVGANYIGNEAMDINVFADIERLNERLSQNVMDGLIVVISPLNKLVNDYSIHDVKGARKVIYELSNTNSNYVTVSLFSIINSTLFLPSKIVSTGQIVVRLVSLLTNVRNLEFIGISMEVKQLNGIVSRKVLDYSFVLDDCRLLGFKFRQTNLYSIIVGSDRNQTLTNRAVMANLKSIFEGHQILFTHNLYDASSNAATKFSDHRVKVIKCYQNFLYIDSDVLCSIDCKFFVDFFFEFAPDGISSSTVEQRQPNLGVMFKKGSVELCDASYSEIASISEKNLSDRFNSLDKIRDNTLFLHFTRIPSQPWSFPLHHLYRIWKFWLLFENNKTPLISLTNWPIIPFEIKEYVERFRNSVYVLIKWPRNIFLISPLSYIRYLSFHKILFQIEYNLWRLIFNRWF
jgi:hypothetical protein